MVCNKFFTEIRPWAVKTFRVRSEPPPTGACVARAVSDPLIPLVAWASEQIDYLGGMKAGQFLSTGTLNVPIPTGEPVTIDLTLGGVGTAQLTLVS